MKHQQIIDAIKDALANINTVNGYLTDIGTYPIRDWSSLNVDLEDMPYVNIRDTRDDLSIEDIGVLQHSLVVNIDVIVNGDDSAKYVREAYNDIMKAIGNSLELKDIAFEVKADSCEIAAHQSMEKVMIISVKFTVTYITDYWDT